MLLLDPELAEERANEIIQRIRDSVEGAGGTWDGHEPWGRRRLAYEIDHKGEAVYHLLLFTRPPRRSRRSRASSRSRTACCATARSGASRAAEHQKAPAQARPVPAVAAPSDGDGDRAGTLPADDTAEAAE